MTNRLADSLSPYLLQHQNNPVDWYPWGEEAFEEAKASNRPIFLSVGYAACHWCHVMERESFENDSIAEFLNRYFVSIKVDREERPDIDQIYMNAVQVMTGRGGWPMSVFLNHEKKPFYAGTYWPPTNRAGMPGFAQVLDAIADAWQERPHEVRSHADQITQALAQLAEGSSASDTDPTRDAELAGQWVPRTCNHLTDVLDRREGGFGGAPKFPHATDLLLLLSQVAQQTHADRLHAVELTLQKMAAGGIFDQIGGGFARYSVDSKWLVPHFEKMLYDNGLLAEVYTRAYQVTGRPAHAEIAERTLNYLLRDMLDPSGAFHSSEDADSEGIEGKFYVWQPQEVIDVLGPERGRRFCERYDITEQGNFEGASIPHLPDGGSLENGYSVVDGEDFRADLEALRLIRDKRVHPGRDDKVITGWNALVVRALAIAGPALRRPRYVDAAVRTSEFIHQTMRSPDGRLLHAYRRGTAHQAGFLDDHALTVDAWVAVYQATGESKWISRAEQLADQMLEHFWDETNGGFFYTADDAETLITRNKDWHDGSLVSGNGAAVSVLLRLADLTHRTEFRDHACGALRAATEVLQKQSAAAASLVQGLDQFHRSNSQIVLSVSSLNELSTQREKLFQRHRPCHTLAWHLPDDVPVPLASDKPCVEEPATLYLCEQFTCEAPVSGVQLQNWHDQEFKAAKDPPHSKPGTLD